MVFGNSIATSGTLAARPPQLHKTIRGWAAFPKPEALVGTWSSYQSAISMGESKRVKLKSSPRGSTSWVYIANDGSFVVEFYDYGLEAEEVFGNDIAFLLKVAPEQKRMLLERLCGKPVDPHVNLEEIDSRLLREFEQRFGNYFEVRAWFDANGIPYSHEFDSWA